MPPGRWFTGTLAGGAEVAARALAALEPTVEGGVGGQNQGKPLKPVKRRYNFET